MQYIRYSEGYRFQLEADYQHQTALRPAQQGGNRFVRLGVDGLLTIAAGYAWDGASGPAINTPTILKGSLVHDACYQLIRLGVVPLEQRDIADQLLREICLSDGMWPVRAAWVYQAVHLFGGRFLASKGQGNEILTAP